MIVAFRKPVQPPEIPWVSISIAVLILVLFFALIWHYRVDEHWGPIYENDDTRLLDPGEDEWALLNGDAEAMERP